MGGIVYVCKRERKRKGKREREREQQKRIDRMEMDVNTCTAHSSQLQGTMPARAHRKS